MMRPPLMLTALILLFGLAWIMLLHFPLPVNDHLALAISHRRYQPGGEACDLFDLIGGGHWYLAGNAILLALIYLTGWSHTLEALLCAAFLLAAFALWARFMRQAGASAWTLPFTAFILFSVDQYNLLWPYQLSQFLCIAGIMLAVTRLFDDKAVTPARFLAALAGVIIAVYCHAAGLVAALAIAMLLPLHARTRACFLPWLLATAALAAHYVYAWKAGTPPAAFAVKGGYLLDPSILLAIPKSIGGALMRFDRNGALIAALLSLGFTTFVLWRLRRHTKPQWMACATLMATAVGVAIMSYIGRHSEGVGGVANPRYTTMANLYWLGFGSLYLLYPTAFYLKEHLRPAIAFMTILLCCKLANTITTGEKNYRTALEYRQMAQTLQSHPPGALPDAFFQPLGTTPSIVRDLYIYTRDNRLSIYRP